MQHAEITQLAIDRQLTLIAFEAMNHWTAEGGFSLHVFHKNNELAGYCSVLHALQLIGTTGDYGRRLRAAVIGSGATWPRRGDRPQRAWRARRAHLHQPWRHRRRLADPFRAHRFEHDLGDPSHSHALRHGARVPLAPFLAEHDIVVN